MSATIGSVLAQVSHATSTQQYGRQFSLVVSTDAGKGIEFSSLRCTFSIRRGDIQTPNSVDARIYNLSNNTANQIAQPEFTTITIKAGYPGNYAQVFAGSIKQVRRGRASNTDTYVDITAADSDHAYNFAPISVSLPSATTNNALTQITNALANDDVTIGPLPTVTQNQLPRGKVLYGAVRDEIRQLAEQNDWVWSIQDGIVTFIPRTQYIAAAPLVISPTTGLIGIPEQTANGIEIRTLLNPSIKIGTSIKLQGTVNALRYGLDSASIAANQALQAQVTTNADGLYYVMYVNHTGDTRGQPWYSDLICLSVSAQLPPNVDLSNKLFSQEDVVPRVP